MVYFDDQIIILHQNHQMNLLLFDVHTVFMSEFFNGVLNQEHVIEANKQMCIQSSEEFGLDDETKLDEIINHIKSVDRIEDKKERIVRKVSILIVGLAYSQPFKNGNKRTALSISLLLLRINNYDIPFQTKLQKQKIFDLLENLMFKFEDDVPYLNTEVESFLRNNIINI